MSSDNEEVPPTGADTETDGRETEAESGETAVTLSRADLSSLVESAVQRALASRPQPQSTAGGELSVSQVSSSLHTFPPPGWRAAAPATPGSHAWEYCDPLRHPHRVRGPPPTLAGAFALATLSPPPPADRETGAYPLSCTQVYTHWACCLRVVH